MRMGRRMCRIAPLRVGFLRVGFRVGSGWQPLPSRASCRFSSFRFFFMYFFFFSDFYVFLFLFRFLFGFFLFKPLCTEIRKCPFGFSFARVELKNWQTKTRFFLFLSFSFSRLVVVFSSSARRRSRLPGLGARLRVFEVLAGFWEQRSEVVDLEWPQFS